VLRGRKAPRGLKGPEGQGAGSIGDGPSANEKGRLSYGCNKAGGFKGKKSKGVFDIMSLGGPSVRLLRNKKAGCVEPVRCKLRGSRYCGKGRSWAHSLRQNKRKKGGAG